MLNKTLFLREIKANYKMFLIFAAVLTMYPAVIIAMFDPKLGNSLNLMMESMPDLFAAFNMQNPGSTLIEFLINYLYGFLLVVFPMVFLILLANKLVARYVDNGSMVYLIATPNKRSHIIRTQALFLLASTLLLVIYVTGISIALCSLMFPGDLDIPKFLLINVGLLGVHVFLGGLCFFSSCFFSDTRLSTGVSAGFCIAFFLLQMLSQVGDKFEFLKYATPLTLFQPQQLISGDMVSGLSIFVLYLVGLLLAAAGIFRFSKKDLPI